MDPVRTGIKDNLISIFISPWFLALPVSVGIILFFVQKFDKYEMELVRQGVCDKSGSYVTMGDIDGDGFSEKITLFNNQEGVAAIKIVNQSDVQLNWTDFRGVIYKDAPECADFDHNDTLEIYFTSYLHDSAFLNILTLNPGNVYTSRQRFITRTNVRDSINDYTIYNWHFCDLQLDGNDEVLFPILAGYSLQPRQLFAYDQVNDSLWKSPLMGSKTVFNPVQLDDDPDIEFIGQSSSSDNIGNDSEIPYKDSSSWLMALDHRLKFIFEPVEFPGHKTNLLSQVLREGDSIRIISLLDYTAKDSSKNLLILFNSSGKILKQKNICTPAVNENYTFVINRVYGLNDVYLKDKNGLISSVDINLNLTGKYTTPAGTTSMPIILDIDRDGEDEYILPRDDFESIHVLRNDFSHVTEAKIPFERKAMNISLQENSDDPPNLYIQRGEREYWFSYGINKLWYARIPLWIGIYLFILGFIHIIRKFQVIQQKKVKAYEEKLAELQLNTVSNYLDPHFTFNALNTISSLIYKEEKGKAYEILTGFTSMIRAALNRSGQTARTLGEELDFVKSYLSIQQFRFGNIFTWEISNEDNADLSVPVPKIMVQLYAENAVKHGLKNKGAGGKLTIIVRQQEQDLIVRIRDNGIGREKAKSLAEPGTGKGIETMQKIYRLFERIHKIRIEQEITDLKDESGNAAGTEVVLRISKI